MCVGWLFWCPTKANYSVFRAFKFRNPATEEAYQRYSNRVQVTVATSYFVFSFLLNAINCVSYFTGGKAVLPVPFWCFLACCAGHAAALLTLTLCPSLRRRVLLFHTLMVLLSVGVYSYLGVALAEDWLADALLHLRGAFPPTLVDEVSGMLAAVLGDHSRATMSFSCQLQLIALSFMGFNVSSIPIWLSFFIAFVSIAAVGQAHVAFSVAFYACELLLLILPFLFLCICIEALHRSHFHAQQELLRELEISQMAESMLHSTTTNVLSDAAANIQEYLGAASQATEALLRDTLAGLARGIRSCRHRQAFLSLVSDSYQPHFSLVSLREFGEELVAGRAVAGEFAEGHVLVDPLLCNLVLENAIAHAFQHGHPSRPNVRVRIFSRAPVLDSPLRVSHSVEAVFEVSFVCGEGDAFRRSEFEEVLSQTVDALPAQVATPRHLQMAADAHGMSVEWVQDRDRVVFRATCPAVRGSLPPTPADPPPQHLLDAFPAGLMFYIIDDSVAARRLLSSCINQLAAPAAVHCFGTYPEDVHQFVGAASHDADIVICDQHLDYGDQHYLGSDLVRSLRDRGFQGLLCIRSSNMSEDDRELYRGSGAHCMFGKEVLAKDVVNGLKVAYVQLKGLDHSEEAEAVSPWTVRGLAAVRLQQPPTHASSGSSQWGETVRYTSEGRPDGPHFWSVPSLMHL